MATFIKASLRLGRNHFGKFVSSTAPYDNYYNYYFDRSRLQRGQLPSGRGCRICGKIGHKVKECELRRQKGNRNNQQRHNNVRTCNGCGSEHHMIRECPAVNAHLRSRGQYAPVNAYQQQRRNNYGQPTGQQNAHGQQYGRNMASQEYRNSNFGSSPQQHQQQQQHQYQQRSFRPNVSNAHYQYQGQPNRTGAHPNNGPRPPFQQVHPQQSVPIEQILSRMALEIGQQQLASQLPGRPGINASSAQNDQFPPLSASSSSNASVSPNNSRFNAKQTSGVAHRGGAEFVKSPREQPK